MLRQQLRTRGLSVGRLLAIAVAFSVLGLAACSGADSSDGPALGFIGVEPGADGTYVEKLDINGDRRVDVWRHYRDGPPAEGGGKPQRILFRKEVDLNFDGRPDLSIELDDQGALLREEFDLDFDRRIDMVTEYRDGVLWRQIMDDGFDGTIDVWRYFEGGKLVRKERDLDGDGTVDLWEYYESGKLIRTGRDLDGDGRPELFEEAAE